MTETEVISELKDKESHHSKWQDKDFSKAQKVLWIGILASVIAALHAAGALTRPDWLDPSWAKFLAAAVAGTPALAIMVDKTFKWGARSSWHALFAIRLRKLIRSVRDQEVSPVEVSKSLGDLEVEMHNAFPPLDASFFTAK